MTPEISIVLPVYNVADYLAECLDSLLGQTLANIEIICVDDCSTDGSDRLLREYAARDGRVRVFFHQQNGTAAQCRKDGALATTGRYVLFVDPDDYLQRDACERLLALARKSDADVLQFGAKAFGASDIPQSRIDMIDRMLAPFSGRLEGDDLCEKCFVEKKFSFQIWNKLFRGDLCRAAMREFPDGRFPKAQDLLAVYILLFFARSYQGMQTGPMYMYRVGVGVTGGNVLTRRQIAGYAAQSLIPRAIRAFLEQKGAFDEREESYLAVEQQLSGDSFARLCGHVARADRACAFDVYCEQWGAEKVVGELARRGVDGQKEWARDLAGAHSLQFVPRKVGCIGAYYYRLKNGGAQRVVAMLLELWARMGYRVVAFTDEEAVEGEYALPEGVVRVALGKAEPNSTESCKEHARRLHAAVKQHGVDMLVYHAWLSPVILWDLLAVKSAGAAFLVHTHSVFSMPFITQGMGWAYQMLPEVYSLCDGVLTLSDADRQYWSAYNPRVFRVINPLTFRLADVPVNELRGRNILWVGRISREKRPLQALEIFAIVAQREPEATLTMVGGGNAQMEESMHKRAAELGVAERVRFCGFQEDVRPYYAGADVFLSTGQYEGFPLTFLEAQSSGVPVVTYDMPYLSILRTGLGSVRVPQEDCAQAAEEIIRLLQDDQARMQAGRAARQNIAENFDVDLVQMWSEIIGSLTCSAQETEAAAQNRLMLDTLREHIRMGAENGAGGMAGQNGLAAPMPQTGPCRMLRKKICTMINLLLIEGPSGLTEAMRKKREGE